MNILKTKKNTIKKTVKTNSKEVTLAKKTDKESPSLIKSIYNSTILRPRITEKSGDISQKLNAYTFEIKMSSSKHEVAQAVKNFYKVNPVKINIIRLPRKRILSRGKKGWSGGVKKAIVYLKEGDKIEFI